MATILPPPARVPPPAIGKSKEDFIKSKEDFSAISKRLTQSVADWKLEKAAGAPAVAQDRIAELKKEIEEGRDRLDAIVYSIVDGAHSIEEGWRIYCADAC